MSRDCDHPRTTCRSGTSVSQCNADTYCHTGVDAKGSRKIFHCVPYTPFEERELQRLDDTLQARRIGYTSDWTTADSLKMLYNAKFEIEKAVQNVIDHSKWRTNEARKVMPRDVPALMNSSFIFSYGKDRQFRPIVYVRLQIMKNKKKYGLDDRIDYESIDEALDWIMCLVRKEAFKEYFIENWIMIIDCDEMGVLSFPVKFLTRFLKIMQLHHAACLHRLYLVNTPFSFSSVWSMAKPFIPPDTQTKILILGSSERTKLLVDIDKDQLLSIYGGSLPMPAAMWPIPPTTLSQQAVPVNMPASHPHNYVYTPPCILSPRISTNRSMVFENFKSTIFDEKVQGDVRLRVEGARRHSVHAGGTKLHTHTASPIIEEEADGYIHPHKGMSPNSSRCHPAHVHHSHITLQSYHDPTPNSQQHMINQDGHQETLHTQMEQGPVAKTDDTKPKRIKDNACCQLI